MGSLWGVDVVGRTLALRRSPIVGYSIVAPPGGDLNAHYRVCTYPPYPIQHTFLHHGISSELT